MIFDYKKILFALLLIVIDFNLTFNLISVDIIPDFIGYFMLASFFKYIPSEDYNKKIPVILSYILGTYSLLMIFLPPLVGNSTLVALNLILNIVFAAINLGVNYFICKVIIGEARKYRKASLLSFAYRTWYIVATYSICFMIISPFFINYSIEASVLFIPLFILGFLEIILLICLAYRASKLLPKTLIIIEE